MSEKRAIDSFTAADQTGLEVELRGAFNYLVDFDAGSAVGGTMQMQRKLPGEGNFSDIDDPFSATQQGHGVGEPEAGTLYRWKCTAITSGTIRGRLSQ